MLRVLVLDDDPSKAERIVELIQGHAGAAARVETAKDLITARDLVRRHSYDLLVLDVRVPNRAGDDPDDYGGCEFVKELEASQTVFKPYHIVGLTEHPELFTRAGGMLSLWRIIQYDRTDDSWREQLGHIIDYLAKLRSELASRGEPFRVDLALVTAVPDLELRSLLRVPASWLQREPTSDGAIYHEGVFRSPSKTLTVVAATTSQMGMAAAAVLCCKVINAYRPKYLALIGIAASMPGGPANYGDLLIADQCWDYGSGKIRLEDSVEVFDPDPRPISIGADLKDKFVNAIAKRAYLTEIEDAWPGPRATQSLNAHFGPFASGAAVVQSEQFMRSIQKQSRKVVGIDMEAYGVCYAAAHFSSPHPSVFIVKSVSDYGNIHKEDTHREYAAYTAVRYVELFALDHLIPLGG